MLSSKRTSIGDQEIQTKFVWWTPWKVKSWKAMNEMEEQSQKVFVKNWL
jgi:hypothetical protein